MTSDEDIFDVLCYGTISVENVTHVPYLPSPRRDVTATQEYNRLGGEALRVALPLATWGLRVLVAGNFIGHDQHGSFIQEHLAAHPRIDMRHVRQHENCVTPFSRILVTPDGEHSRITYWYDEMPTVELTEAAMHQARVLSVDAYGRDERDRAALVARRLGKTIISADAIWLQYPMAGHSNAVVISNGWLHANYPDIYEYDHGLELQSQGAGVIIITDSARPVLVIREDGSAFGVEPYPASPLVSTADAGNAFKAGIIYGWLQPEWSLEQRVRFACAAASLSCSRPCEHDNPPTLAEITSLMAA